MRIARLILAVISTGLAILLIAPIVVLGLPFYIVTFLTRAISRFLEPNFVPWNRLIEFDPVIGWKSKANLNNHHYYIQGDDIFGMTTDSHGWVGKTSISDCEILIFGDSFAIGYGVDTRACFAELNSHLRIKAIASPGYNMVQGLLLLRNCAHLAGKLVVWFICLDNDLYDNLRPNKPNYYRTPFVRSINAGDDWEIVTSHLRAERWHFNSDKVDYLRIFANLCGPSFLSRRAYSACAFLIKEANNTCHEAGAQLVVMTIPNKHQLNQRGVEFLLSQDGNLNELDPDFPDENMGEICRKSGVPFVAGKKYLDVEDYKDRDVHWNERGHQRIAELLSRLYRAYLSGELGVMATRNSQASNF